MYITREIYDLEHSRLAIVFQILCGLVISALLYIVLHPALWLLSSVLLVLTAWMFQRSRPRLQQLAELDQQEWSLKLSSEKDSHTVHVEQWLQHGWYVVLYYRIGKQKFSTVIWRDQLSRTHWKQLLQHAHLQ